MLSELKPGQTGRIVRVGGEERLQHRLYDLGLLPGTAVTLTRIAPLGDPIELLLRGYSLSLRLSHAKQIQMEEVRPLADRIGG